MAATLGTSTKRAANAKDSIFLADSTLIPKSI
jgi:hypothetical protein